MATNPGSSLTPEELATLREIAKGRLATEVPPEHAEKLTKRNLITKVRFQYFLTEVGKRLLALGQP
jgi:hypothetical protein